VWVIFSAQEETVISKEKHIVKNIGKAVTENSIGNNWIWNWEC
jgi:hypothetical protein